MFRLVNLLVFITFLYSTVYAQSDDDFLSDFGGDDFEEIESELDFVTTNVVKEKFTDIPFFKTDSNYLKVPAAWLIDKCGFKKINDENVGVYKNQPLVIINLGNASGNEIINFAKRIKDSVFNEFDIELEEEVIVM